MTTLDAIAERWVMGDLLGVGGGGRVWKVTDRYTGQVAALKLLRVSSEVQKARVEREIHALRLLQVPGVVQLLDVGEHLGEPYLVTEYIAGEGFPGPGVGREWSRLLPRLRELLGVLVHIHRRGLVHRDLKPDNVLVDASGRVTVLDFGLARGGELAATVTRPGFPVGTPRYLAPEQLRGEPVDARTDLYALGALLFEWFTGRPPYPDATFTERFLTLRIPPAPPLAELAPDAPPAICALVDAMLALAPADRPPSAAHVLHHLSLHQPAAGAASPRVTLPMVGRRQALVELVVAAHEGRSLGVRSAPGMGRTRLLREAARRLGGEGRTVGFCVPGSRPLESVQPLVGVPSSRDAIAELGEKLRERVAAGLVVVVDDPARLDTWSAKLLARAAAEGSVLGLADGEVVELGPLDEATLVQLFAGPSRVLHLPEDAAAVLHARTAGVPARVAGELTAWLAAGLASWDGERVTVDRATLDRLMGGLDVGEPGAWTAGSALTLEEGLADRLAWVVLAGGPVSADTLARAAEAADWEVEAELAELVGLGALRRRSDGRVEALTAPARLHTLAEAERERRHRALARAMTPGTPERLLQWLLVGEAAGAIEEALLLSGSHRASGRSDQAAALLLGTWTRVRALATEAQATGLLAELVRAVISGTSAPQRIQTEAALVQAGLPALEPLRALLVATRAAAEGQLLAAEQQARAIPAFEDPALELPRLAVIARSLNERRAPEAEPFFNALGEHPLAQVRARAWLWLGLQRYEEERFAEAARLHERASDGGGLPIHVARGLVNAGVAWLEVDPARARELAGRLIRLAAEHRMALPEMWGWHIQRAATYRQAEALPADPDLIALSAQIGEPRRHAHLLLVEAAAAWRRGDERDARQLAEASAALVEGGGLADLAVLARALAVVAGAAPPPELRARVLALARPRLQLQAMALLGTVGERFELRADALAPLRAFPERCRLDILDRDEIGEQLRRFTLR